MHMSGVLLEKRLKKELYGHYSMAKGPDTELMRKVFGWMFLGLLVSSLAAYAATNVPSINALVMNTLAFWLLVIVEVILVIVIGMAINKISPETATFLFVLYAALSGLTISVILLLYNVQTIALAFMSAAGMFGVMALAGYTTKRDLSSLHDSHDGACRRDHRCYCEYLLAEQHVQLHHQLHSSCCFCRPHCL
jgi:FtsH-binding integral membrane protein